MPNLKLHLYDPTTRMGCGHQMLDLPTSALQTQRYEDLDDLCVKGREILARSLACWGTNLHEVWRAAIAQRVNADPLVIKARERFKADCDKTLYLFRSALEKAEGSLRHLDTYAGGGYGSGQDTAADLLQLPALISSNINIRALMSAAQRFDAIMQVARRAAEHPTPMTAEELDPDLRWRRF